MMQLRLSDMVIWIQQLYIWQCLSETQAFFGNIWTHDVLTSKLQVGQF